MFSKQNIFEFFFPEQAKQLIDLHQRKENLQRFYELNENSKAVIILRNNTIFEQKKKLNQQINHISGLRTERANFENRLIDLQNSLLPGELESFWNNRRKKNDNYRHPCRTLLDSKTLIQIDPRLFLNYDSSLPTFSGTNDEIARKTFNYVKRRITYITENREWWQFPYETIKRYAGDCEDGSHLIHAIMLKSGVDYWRIRDNAGWVFEKTKKFGHCYTTYLAEKDNKWKLLDWCFKPKACLNLKCNFDIEAEEYGELWFSWNKNHIYLNDNYKKWKNISK